MINKQLQQYQVRLFEILYLTSYTRIGKNQYSNNDYLKFFKKQVGGIELKPESQNNN